MADVNNSSKKIFLIMAVIATIGFAVSYFYYGNVNKNTDPRLIEAQEILSRFDNINKLDSPFVAIELMDNLQYKLQSIDLYKNSYEMGVVINNRASVYIMMAIYDDKYTNMKDSLFNLSLSDLKVATTVLNNWIDNNKTIDKNAVKAKLKTAYTNEKELFKNIDIDKAVDKRLEEIELAKTETPRRLSVVYSNIAVVKRHTNELDEAIKYYQQAIELWPENHETKNNLKVLMGEKPEKRNVIEKLFPSKRD